MEILNRQLRYVIPFYYRIEKGKCFCDVAYEIGQLKNEKNKPLWKHLDVDSFGENELFPHIVHMYKTDSDMMSAWEWTQNRKQFLAVLDGTDWKISIQKVGLQIFESGVGFLWYQAALETEQPDQILNLNANLKEFAYKNEYKVKLGKDLYETFDLNTWLLDFLKPLNVESYIVERTIGGKKIPDKAHIFSWVFCAGDEIEVKVFGKRLAKGYNSHYQVGLDETLSLFENSCWYGDWEGCGNVTIQNETANSIFENGFEKRLDTYFQIYLFALHEHFTELQLSEQIGRLPAHIERCPLETLKEMEKRFISLKMKYVYTQVSHISHQNLFYRYLREHLENDKALAALDDKVHALKEYVEIRVEKQKNDRFLIFTLISAMFITLQTICNVFGIYDWVISSTPLGWIWTAVILGGTVLLSVILWVCYLIRQKHDQNVA